MPVLTRKRDYSDSRAGNVEPRLRVYRVVTVRSVFAAALVCVFAHATANDYATARAKLDQIESGKLRAGARLQFSANELTAYAVHEAPKGVYRPEVKLVAPGVAVGNATIDFGEVRRGQGNPPGWLLSKLLDGQRPVSVRARIESSSGQATVTVESVDINGITVDGRTLDFLIQTFVLPLYPSAQVDRPFVLGDRVERLDVQPGGVNVLIGK